MRDPCHSALQIEAIAHRDAPLQIEAIARRDAPLMIEVIAHSAAPLQIVTIAAPLHIETIDNRIGPSVATLDSILYVGGVIIVSAMELMAGVWDAKVRREALPICDPIGVEDAVARPG